MLPVLDLTTNVSQIFTEMYRYYSLLNNTLPSVPSEKQNLASFEEALYLNSNIQAQEIFTLIDKRLKDYMLKRGDYELFVTENSSLLLGNGSTQIYKGLVYALSLSYPEKNFLFVEQIPYFSGHRDAVENSFPYTNVRWQGFNNREEIVRKEGEVLVEFVTSPNNPDGVFRYPVCDPDIIIADFVFASTAFNGYIRENITWIEKYRSRIPVFSFNSASKQFGHTGDRLGYMWFPSGTLGDWNLDKIHEKIQNFMSFTVGTNSWGTMNFINFLPILSSFISIINKDIYDSLTRRFYVLSSALQIKYPGSVVKSLPYSPTFFIRIADERLERMTAAEIIFQDTQVRVSDGKAYGESSSFVRINIMAYAYDLQTFLYRLGYNNKEPLTLFSGRETVVNYTVSNYSSSLLTYTVIPNNKIVHVVAQGPINIVLPPFLGYEFSDVIIRRKCGKGEIIVISEGLRVKVKRETKFYWKQPLYRDGHWSKEKNIILRRITLGKEGSSHPSFLV